MNKKEIKEKLDELGVEYNTTLKKDELLELLENTEVSEEKKEVVDSDLSKPVWLDNTLWQTLDAEQKQRICNGETVKSVLYA